MAAPLLTLDMLISEACELFAPNDAPTRYYDAGMKHAKAFRRELIQTTSRENRTAFLEIGNDRTAALPDDYVQYARLGVLSDDEQSIYPLIYSDDIPLTERSTYPSSAWPCEWMRTGGFRIDNETRRVVCNSLVPQFTILVLDYKAFGAETGEDIAIDPLCHTWAVQYILRELHKQKKDWQSAGEAERDMNRAKALYKQSVRDFTLAGAMQIRHETAAQRWK
jgi:hypothetical protein